MSPRYCSSGGTSLLKCVFVRVARGLVRLRGAAKKPHVAHHRLGIIQRFNVLCDRS
jgi:hypothetical protein